MGTKIVLTSDIRAAILAGATEIEVDEATLATAPGAQPVKLSSAEVSAATTAAAAAPATPAADAGVVAFLTGQLAEKDRLLVESSVKVAQLEAAGKDNSESVPGLLAIAKSVIGSMQVALGGSDNSKALTAKDAVTEHARLQPVYVDKFKTGGIAVPHGLDTPAPVVIHPAFAQRLAAARAFAKAQ